MTQEEFLKKYEGKNIELQTTEDEEIVWMFNIKSVDFVKTQEGVTFLGWIAAEKSIFGYPDKIEIYKEEDGQVILRPEDKITVFETAEKLQERIIEHVKKHLLCGPKQK